LIAEALAAFFSLPVRGDRSGIKLVDTDRSPADPAGRVL
jgi:hypothetical protein